MTAGRPAAGAGAALSTRPAPCGPGLPVGVKGGAGVQGLHYPPSPQTHRGLQRPPGRTRDADAWLPGACLQLKCNLPLFFVMFPRKLASALPVTVPGDLGSLQTSYSEQRAEKVAGWVVDAASNGKPFAELTAMAPEPDGRSLRSPGARGFGCKGNKLNHVERWAGSSVWECLGPRWPQRFPSCWEVALAPRKLRARLR